MQSYPEFRNSNKESSDKKTPEFPNLLFELLYIKDYQTTWKIEYSSMLIGINKFCFGEKKHFLKVIIYYYSDWTCAHEHV